MHYIKKDFVPDYQNIVDAASNKIPKRTPLYEHIIDGRIFSIVTGEDLGMYDTGDYRRDYTAHFRRVQHAFMSLGYDAMCYEIGSGGAFPGANALGGHVAGVVTDRASYDKFPWDKVAGRFFDYAAKNYDCARDAELPGMKLIGGVANGIFENVQNIVGLTDLCYIKLDDPELYGLIFEKVGAILYDIWDQFLDRWDDIFCVYRFGDDLGYKLSPMLSPDDIRKHIIPQYKKIIGLIKRKTGKPFLLHSCGNIFSVMDDIIDAGIDAKHSNEDVIAPFSEWIDRYNDRIGLFGGIDTDALCDVSGIDIESYMEERVKPLIGHRGVAIGSGNSITSYVSPERYAKANEMIRRYRGE
ncbi:hypothetical protein FACS1894105_03470 [Clostridia bacterium]|nr:hypothetical protein FACS1894105_03470 [Clostridia bacterium]